MGVSVRGGYEPCGLCGGFTGEVSYGFGGPRRDGRSLAEMWAKEAEVAERARRIENNPCTCRHDLQPGQDLNGANLTKSNLTGANLPEANLTGANLDGAVLDGAVLTGANLRGANLRGANLGEAYLSWADLTRTDLSGFGGTPPREGYRTRNRGTVISAPPMIGHRGQGPQVNVPVQDVISTHEVVASSQS